MTSIYLILHNYQHATCTSAIYADVYFRTFENALNVLRELAQEEEANHHKTQLDEEFGSLFVYYGDCSDFFIITEIEEDFV